jgi:dihydroorotate dehydrogenase electron transfer subunit
MGMKNHLCPITDTRPLWADAHLFTVDAPDLAHSIKPGQFALARETSSLDPYLRRTLWFYGLDNEQVSFTIDPHDPLVQRARADIMLDLLAPLGRAITFEPGMQRILLISDGANPARLVAIAHQQVKLGQEVVVSIVTPSSGSEGFAQLLAPEIELRNDTAMDTELITWADAIVANGSERFYRELSQVIRAVRYRVQPGFSRALVEMPMPCGTGICYACAVDTSRGIKRLCLDGPALDLADLR